MKKLAVLLIVLLAAAACQPKPATRPQPLPRLEMPPAPPQSAPARQVEDPQEDFPETPEPREDELPADINALDRKARASGWIQDAFFAFDASTLDESAQTALRQSAEWLREHPEILIRVEGHCDDRGTEQYNLALGDRRAETAASYLATLGVDRARIETVSFGEERPFETGATEAAWAQNRRAHLMIVGRR